MQEKLFSSSNRTEVSLGKKLKIDYLPEIEKIHKVSPNTSQGVKSSAIETESTIAGYSQLVKNPSCRARRGC